MIIHEHYYTIISHCSLIYIMHELVLRFKPAVSVKLVKAL